MNRKRICHLFEYSVNLLLITLLFIVIHHSESEDQIETNSPSIANTSNTSSTHESQHRDRRSVRRGENNYYQRGYEMNRLRHEVESALRAPRHKPYFHPVHEVYSYYLPTKFNKINANIENFSKINAGAGRGLYDTRIRSMSSTRGEEFTLTRRIAPEGFQQQGYRTGKVNYAPNSGFLGNREGYKPQPERYIPRVDSRQFIDGYSSGPVGTGAPVRPSYSRPSLPSPPLIPEPPVIRNSSFAGIPGWLRSDYPGYYTIPFTGFRCTSQPYYGYYADVNAGCQVFHVCQPDGREYSFLCPNSTLFHQKVQTCDWWYNVDCPSSPRFYYLNARIGVLPSVDATLYRFRA